MKKIVVLFLALFLTGCINNYERFYKPTVNLSSFDGFKGLQWLQPGEEPKIYNTNNFERDIRSLMSKGYVRIGRSSFNGAYQMEDMVRQQAKNVRATVVLLQARYTDTQTNTSTMYVPNTQTKYYSGSVGGTKFRGTTETHGTTAVPYITQQRRYDQVAVYFVKSNHKATFGIRVKDLTDKMRQDLERNTGILIYTVIEDSPAFNSNVLNGDILLEVDGEVVRNVKHLTKISRSYDTSKGVSVWKIFRKGKEREIKVKFQ